MYKQITVQTLHKQGVRNSEIARTLGCDRHTVANILNRKTLIEKQTRQKSSMLDPYKQQITDWHKEDISNWRIYEKLQEEYHLHCTYINVCKYMQKHFPKPVEAFGVQQTHSGEEAELDFGYLGKLPGMNGTVVKTWGLVAVLSYSRDAYYAICYDQKLETLIKETTNAFEYFGGIPLRLKIDNMRTAILENQHYDLQFNQDFLEYAKHYNFVIVPCTPYSPEQKGKVESGVKYMQQNFVNGRTFVDDLDIAAQLKDWMENVANQRVHGTTKKVPFVVLQQEEKEKLQPLPETPFAFFNRSVRKVAPNCHIHFENNYYSVPALLVGKEVTVRWNDHFIRIVFQGEQVALHTKATGTGNFVTVRNHLPDYKIYSENERQVKYETKMREVGADAHEYFRWLLERREKYWFVIVRCILGLTKTYGNDAVNKALKRALSYQVNTVVTIKNILEKKSYLEEIEPKLLDMEKIYMQEENTLCRNLSYYSVQP